jgi:hypothetical protein
MTSAKPKSHSKALVIAAVVLAISYVVATVALGTPPTASDPPADVISWLQQHYNGVRIHAWAITIGLVAFAVLAGIVRNRLPRPFNDIFLLGAAAFIAETAVSTWLWGALALHPDSLEPATARTILDIVLFWGPVLTASTLTMIGSVTALGFTHPAGIPKWLTILGVVVLVEQLAETVTIFGTHGFFGPGGDMNLVLGAGLTLIWLGAIVVWAAREATEPV